jgi:ferritin-like metal-binding protein YciE
MTSQELIANYIEDAEAAENNFTHSLLAFGQSGDQNQVKSFFEWSAARAKTQRERLEVRLRELGGAPSTAKSIIAHLLAFSPTLAQFGHEPAEKNTQHLIMSVGAAAAEMAMYEALATVAATAGDTKTEKLARELQAEERDDYEKAWKLLPGSAENAFHKVVTKGVTA